MKNNPNIENKFKRIFVLCPEFACLKISQPPGSTSLSQLRHQHPEILSSVVLFTEILLRFFGVRNDLEKKTKRDNLYMESRSVEFLNHFNTVI